MRIALSLLVLAPVVASTALFAACGGGTLTGLDDEGDASTTSSSSSSSGAVVTDAGDGSTNGMPNLADLPANQFSFIPSGGDTKCAFGTEYGFAVRPGDPTKVVVEFEGGGACFSDGTCAGGASKNPATVTFKDYVRGTDYTTGSQVGLRNHDNAANPIAGWTHVIVPYCSADVHWGDKQTTYGANTIEHRGAANTKSVLSYIYSQIAAPEHIFMTGCSAGGYGSIYWTPDLAGHYPNAKFRHFSDSAAGVFPAAYFEILRDSWGFTSTFPTSVGTGDDFKTLAYLYEGVGAKFPSATLSQYNVVQDTTQSVFMSLMGGSGWTDGMKANVGEIVDNVPNFRSYGSPGSTHCIIEKDEFYTKTVADTKLTDWLKKMVDDEDVPNVACPTCTLPTTKGDAGTDAGN